MNRGLRATNAHVARDGTGIRWPLASPIRVCHGEGIKMKTGIRNMARGAALVAALTMLTACGGGR